MSAGNGAYATLRLNRPRAVLLGCLACALGWRDDERIRNLSQQLRIGVRCDRSGTRPRWLTITPWVAAIRTPMLLTAEGKPKWSSKRPHTEQTWRSYLCDASFLVAIQGGPENSSLIAELAEAVQSPVWPIYLGRKSCVPTLPVYAGVGMHSSLRDALEAVALQKRISVDHTSTRESASSAGMPRFGCR